MIRGNGKTSAAIKCHFVYSITYRQPCFVPVANGFEKNDYRRLGTERGDADLAAFRLLCFVYARSAFGSKVYGREPSFLGTPYCITVDHDTLKDNCVTIRFRDTMEQERVSIDKLHDIISEKVSMKNLLKKIME